MKVVWVLVLTLYMVNAAEGIAKKKFDSSKHSAVSIKKAITAENHKAESDSVTTASDDKLNDGDVAAEDKLINEDETDLSAPITRKNNEQQQDIDNQIFEVKFNIAKNEELESNATFLSGVAEGPAVGKTAFNSLDADGLVVPEKKNIVLGGAVGDFITNILNTLGGIAIPDPFTGIGTVLTGLFAIGAAILAGVAALAALLVPPLQIANQVLAIIAISLLIAYAVEDKSASDYYYDDIGYDTTGYDIGYSSYPESTGYAAPAAIGYEEPGTGYSAPVGSVSSYSSYRRLDDTNSIDEEETASADQARSHAPSDLVKSISSMVSDAVKKYSDLYKTEAN